ncbi:inositol monophosphatase family protein [Algoriphagus namhaensis]|uniref:Inositol-1-monophosphatase n=1 Tax=Algoriphagus namhaensis TaxID=915353 RepID=A0ABV8AT18_9BACT
MSIFSDDRLDQILAEVQSIAKEAGAFIRQERLNFKQSKVEHKGFNDLVSYVDKEAEKLIVQRLEKLLPEAGFITEEGTNTTQSDSLNWIIDPLDGTTNFIHALPVFSVSIGLEQKGKVILGVVYEVNRSECFSARKAGGAFCNDERIEVSPAPDLSASLLATGFPYYDFEQIDKYLFALKGLMQKTHGLRRMGSAAVDLAYVACGRFEGYFEYNLNSYDVAAGIILVQEAGGKVTDFSGGENYLFGREVVASNGQIHSEFLSEVESIWT